MNTKRFILASVVVFIFMNIYEMLVHGFLLSGVYNETPDLWRLPEDMNMVYMILAYAVMSLLLTYLFTQKMNVRTMKAGAWAGLWVGLPFAVAGAMPYLWMPISFTLAACWFVAGLIKVVAMGKIAGWLYKD